MTMLDYVFAVTVALVLLVLIADFVIEAEKSEVIKKKNK